MEKFGKSLKSTKFELFWKIFFITVKWKVENSWKTSSNLLKLENSGKKCEIVSVKNRKKN